MNVDPLRRLKIDSVRAVWRKVADEYVVLDLETSSYLSVSGSGTAMWNHLETGVSRMDLVDAIVQEFDVAADVAEHDVDTFVADLDRRGLLEA